MAALQEKRVLRGADFANITGARRNDEGVVDVWGGLPSVARRLWLLQGVQVEGVMPPLSLW